jgi:hypothetical protein
MAWISSFYIAALRAGEAMATACKDASFAQRCRRLADSGRSALVKTLYNGEYFIHKMDPKHPDTTNTNDGCHIDQLMGQAWAMQVGLPRIVPEAQSLSALEAIWKYNFTPDVGPFREKSEIKGGRWYAMQGEGGVVMTTFPRGGVEKATGKGHFGFYFNEVWTGQEHQLAAHMIWEGMVEKGLVITRMLHDRHHASRRNPYNEVECSDHYARAMSSYGTFIAICGFDYDGPQGKMEFSPKLAPQNFKAAFTSAEGWGTYSQSQQTGRQIHQLDLHWGKLRLTQITVTFNKSIHPGKIRVMAGQSTLSATLEIFDAKAKILFGEPVTLHEGGKLTIILE